MGARLTPKMTSDEDGPSTLKYRNDMLYTSMQSIGPSELVLIVSIYLYYTRRMKGEWMSFWGCFRTHIKLVSFCNIPHYFSAGPTHCIIPSQV
jgi:hypothetical protein